MATQRTPPKLSAPRLSVAHQVSSESDISNMDPDYPLNYIERRSKRPRNDEEGKSDGVSLKQELLEMLSSWRKDQNLILNKLCLDMTELKEQNASIKATSVELEKSIKFTSLQYEDMKLKLQNLKQKRKEHIGLISSLENKIDDMQKRATFTVVEFRNVPQNLRQETQQDLCEEVQKLCEPLNSHVQQSDIKDIFKMTSKTGASTIVADFTSILIKNKILNGVKEYNKINVNNKLSSSTVGLPGIVKPIYIAESLTNKDSKLFAMARETAKSLAYRFCWIKSGKIHMRKDVNGMRVDIKNESDLLKLKKQ